MLRLNAYMNIQVRVLAAQAQKQLAATQAQIRAVDKAADTAGRKGLRTLGTGLSPKQMVAFGSQTQWTGRQLARNFTAPLLLAGAASLKFALDNETAFNRVKKVYGDGSDAMNKIAENELPALKRAFEALSNEYGVQQKEVIGIAGDWAAAGASGLQLAKSVELTMKTMVLGEIEAGKATEALIAIQAQYGQDTEGLIKTINTLNMVENQTGISLAGLIDGMSRAAGVARSSGIDVRHLAAMMAALVPAAGSAANAGNALKTIISRVMSPTQEASQVLKEMGIKMDENSWKSKNAQQRLSYLAEEYKKLGQGVSKNSTAMDENGNVIAKNISAQQAVASTVLASRWQINRFDVLMRELTNNTGYYNRALNATASDTRNAQQATKELNVVLQSSPRRLKQMGVILQNSLANIIQPLIPGIIAFAAAIASMARAFSNLNPTMQKFIMAGFALLAVMGPILIFFGSLVTALGVLLPVFLRLLFPMTAMVKLLKVMAAGSFIKAAAGAATMGGVFSKIIPFIRLKTIALKQNIAMATYAGGVHGMVARKIAAAWAFAKTTVLLNLAIMRLAFIATLTQMVTAAAGWFAANLMASFSATFIAIWQGVALRMTMALAAMRVRMAGMVLVMSLGWAAMLVSARRAMVGMVVAVASGMLAMLAPIMAWGARSVGLWTFVWNTMAAKFLAFRIFMMTTYTAWLAGQVTLLGIAGGRMVALWVVINGRIITTQIAFAARYAAIHAAMAARLVAIHGAVTTWIATRWAAMGAWVTISWASTQAALLTMKAAFAAKWLAMSVAIHTKMLVIWAAGLMRLRAMWLATVMLMTNPALLIARLRGFILIFAKLPALMATIGRAMALALFSPWGLAIAAVIGVVYLFRDQLKQLFSNFQDIGAAVGAPWVQTARSLNLAWQNLVSNLQGAFNRLPQGVQNVFLAVVNIVKAAAKAVYNLFSYFNPFARHSPSLVDNVTSGMAVIGQQYAAMGAKTSGIVNRARRDLEAFRKVTASMGGGEFDKGREDVAKAKPAALPAFDSLVSQLGPLRAAAAAAESAVAKQEATVAKWEASLDSANAAIDRQKNALDLLQDKLSSLQSAYDASSQRMQDFASAPIKGMGAYSDKLFENEMAQKKLRLEMMKWEDVNGNIDDTRNRLAMLHGDIETAQGDAMDLRQAGGGSDILGPITDQIAAMEAQARATEAAVAASPINAMQKEMDKLARDSEMMELERAIEFDPQVRAIEKLVNAQKELSYNEIVAGINKEQTAMAALEPQIKAATTAVEQQEAAIKSAETARDSLQLTYDAEKNKLDQLKDAYQAIADVVRDVESALNDMSGAASRSISDAEEKARKLKGKEEYVSPGLQNFRDAAGGNFPDPGGSALIGDRGKTPIDESFDIDKFTKESGLELEKAMGGLSLTAPFKKAWKKVEDWFGTYIGPFWKPIKTTFEGVIGSIDWSKPLDGMFQNDKVQSGADKILVIWQKIKDAGKGVWEGIKLVWDLFAPNIRKIVDEVIGFAMDLVAKVGPEIAKFGELIMPLGEALKNFFGIVGGILLGIGKVILSIVSEVIGPVFDTLVDLFSNAFQIIRGIVQVFIGIFTLDFKMMGKGILNIFGGLFGAIWAIIKGAVKIIWGVIEGFVKGIVGFFAWLYDVLVGHSIIPDLMKKIWEVFKGLGSLAKWVWDNVLKPVVSFFTSLATGVGTILVAFVSGIFTILKGLWKLGQWVFDNVLKPLLGFFANLWETNLKPILVKLIGLIIGIFTGLAGLPNTIYNNVLKPIGDKFTALWDAFLKPLGNRMLRGFANIFNNIGKAISIGINVGISAINKLIEGLNWVGKNVPGLNFSIGAIGKVTWSDWSPPQFAKGGMLPKSVEEGFVTNRPRAIVGEGGSAPEYVIPTDRRYRDNAMRLYGDLGKKLGAEPIGGFGFDIPGVDIAAAISKVGSTVRKGAVMAAFAAPLKGFDMLMKGMPDRPDPIKRSLVKAKNNIYDWAKGVDNKVPSTPPPGTMGTQNLPGGGWSVIENFLRENGNVARTITSTFRPGDTGSRHSRGLAVDYSGPHRNGGYNDKSLRDIFNALLPIGGNLGELILAGAPFNIKNGQKVPGYAWGTPGAPGNHWNHVHAALAKGGILDNGPVHAMMGEAGPEIVSPLAPLWNRFDRLEDRMAAQSVGNGDVNITINGNLEFPNISNGNDAEAFIRNLEIMARQ